MAWFKVDDGLWGHPKWLGAPHRARALWITAGSWCAAQERDGFVPRHVLRFLDGRPVDAAALVSAGLWNPVDGGWVFHDWTIYQPDAATLAAEREAERESQSDAGVRGNHKRWHVARAVSVPTCPLCVPDDAPDDGPESPEDSGPRSGGDSGGDSGTRSGEGRVVSPRTRTRTRPDIGSPLSVVQSGSHQTQIVTTSTRATASLGLGGETQ